MDKIRISLLVIVAICLIFLILSIFEVGAVKIVWENRVADGQVSWALWVELAKVITPLFAGLILLYQGFVGNILSTVRPTVKVIGFGVLSIAIGFAFEVYQRAFLKLDTVAFGAYTAFFVVGAVLVVWALFDFPARLEARLKATQRPWFFTAVGVTTILTIAFMIRLSIKSPDPLSIISQILYAVLTLSIFIGALRCTMVFAEGRIGRPFLFIAIGGLAIFTNVYYTWLPFTPRINAFHPIHTLWVFCFLITALGAFDMTLSDSING